MRRSVLAGGVLAGALAACGGNAAPAASTAARATASATPAPTPTPTPTYDLGTAATAYVMAYNALADAERPADQLVNSSSFGAAKERAVQAVLHLHQTFDQAVQAMVTDGTPPAPIASDVDRTLRDDAALESALSSLQANAEHVQQWNVVFPGWQTASQTFQADAQALARDLGLTPTSG